MIVVVRLVFGFRVCTSWHCTDGVACCARHPFGALFSRCAVARLRLSHLSLLYWPVRCAVSFVVSISCSVVRGFAACGGFIALFCAVVSRCLPRVFLLP